MSSDTHPPVVIERRYRAPLAEVWALWTTREGFESWWGPEGFRVEVHTIEPRPGGRLDYDMIADTPEMQAAMREMGWSTSHATHGRFAEIRPMTWLVLVHQIDFIPGVETYESRIDVALSAEGDTTRMVVTLHPHRDPLWTARSAEGFASQLGKLDRRYAAAPLSAG
jgi:uncharacterized protein YndB with AHSA1/START domain